MNFEQTQEWWENLPDIWKKIFIGHLNEQNNMWEMYENDDLEIDDEDLERVLELENIEISLSDMGYDDSCLDFDEYEAIAELSPLAQLTHLKTLCLDNVRISNFSVLSTLTDLEHLRINWDMLSDIHFLSPLKKLKHLDLAYNRISDIAVLSELPQLEHIQLSCNKIKDVSPLLALNNLEFLYLNNNQISDVRPLVNLKGNTFGGLVLDGNPISMTEFEWLKQNFPLLNWVIRFSDFPF